MYIQPRTLLARYEAALTDNPQITLLQFAMQNGMSEKTAKNRLDTGRKERAVKVKSIAQVGAVTSFEFDIADGWQQWFLFQSDNHHDSVFCNRELERQHLDEARDRAAIVMIFGDFLDAMQGRFDPRRSMDELRPEYRSALYFDVVADDCAKFLAPYSDNITLVTDGNHELSIIKNGNTDLLGRVLDQVNLTATKPIKRGGYGGWARLVFNVQGGGQIIKNIKYFHGSGGEAPVTRGVIQTNRQAVYLPDADFVINGHSHNAYHIPISRERLAPDGRHFFDIQHHIRIPGYKQDYRDGSGGWEVTRGGVPKPIGAVWVRMNYASGVLSSMVMADIRGPVAVLPGGPELFTGREYAQDTEQP